MNKEVRVPFEEQETTINLLSDSKTASVYSSCTLDILKLKKLQEQHPSEVHVEKEDACGIFVTVPRKWIFIRAPKKRNLTEEQRKAIGEQLNRARKEKNE